MATVAKLQQNGSDVVNLNDGTTYSVETFNPRLPELMAGRYDLVTRVEDKLTLIVKGSTLDAVANALSTLDRHLWSASQNPAKYWEMEWKPDTLTNSGKVTVYEGSVTREGRADKSENGGYVQRATLTFLRDPVWVGSLTSITPDVSSPTMDNDDTPYVVLPTLAGDMPAPCRAILQSSGGNTASAKRALAALKAQGTPSNFSHILQVESADVLYGSLTNQASTNYSPGSAGTTAKRYSGADTTFRQLAQWNKTTNLDAWIGTYLALLRVRENTATPNFRFRFRSGIIVGSSYLPGPWATATKIKTPVSNSGATTEWLLLDLGLVTVPAIASGRQTVYGGFYFDLWGEALAASGSVDLDNLFLFPVGECGTGMGLQVADFAAAFDSGRPTFDSRVGQVPAYLDDGTNFLGGCSGISGGPVYLMPQVSGQRLYFLVTQNEAGYFKHDRTNALSVTLHYQPRWMHMPGTN